MTALTTFKPPNSDFVTQLSVTQLRTTSAYKLKTHWVLQTTCTHPQVQQSNFFLSVMQRGTPPQELIDPANIHPYIVKLSDPTSDLASQYFIVIGAELLVECNSLMSAVFGLLAVHYVFDMHYHPRLGDSLKKRYDAKDVSWKK